MPSHGVVEALDVITFQYARSARRSRSISSCSAFIYPWPGDACVGSVDFPHPAPQHILANIEITRRLCSAYPALPKKTNRLDFKLLTENPLLNDPPSAS
jgi:hypothetical protein